MKPEVMIDNSEALDEPNEWKYDEAFLFPRLVSEKVSILYFFRAWALVSIISFIASLKPTLYHHLPSLQLVSTLSRYQV